MAKASVTFKPKAPKPGPFTQKLKSPSSSGPKMGKPGNSNVKPKASVTFKEKPSTKFTDKLKAPRGAADLKPGDMRSAALKAAQQGESTAAKALRVASPYLKTAGKLMGRANIAVDMIANAQPTNTGEKEWLSNKGPLMKGPTRKPGAPMKPAPGTGWTPKATPNSSAKYPKPAPGSNYSPKSSSSSGMSFNGGTATGRQPMGMSFNGGAVPASSTSDSKYKKGSYTELAYKPTGTAEKRVGGKVTSTTTQGQSGTPASRMQSRYQRDSGLAMDSRKKK